MPNWRYVWNPLFIAVSAVVAEVFNNYKGVHIYPIIRRITAPTVLTEASKFTLKAEENYFVHQTRH